MYMQSNYLKTASQQKYYLSEAEGMSVKNKT